MDGIDVDAGKAVGNIQLDIGVSGDILLMIQRGNIGDDRRNGVNAGNGGGNGDRRGRNLNIAKN